MYSMFDCTCIMITNFAMHTESVLFITFAYCRMGNKTHGVLRLVLVPEAWRRAKCIAPDTDHKIYLYLSAFTAKQQHPFKSRIGHLLQ